MPNKHVDAVIRSIAAATQRHVQEMDDIKDRLNRKQYDADLLQRVRHLVGLAPDPQLEESKNGDKC